MSISYGIKRIFARVAHVFDELHIARRQLDLDITKVNTPKTADHAQKDKHKIAIRIKYACLAKLRDRYVRRAEKYGFNTAKPA